MLFDLRGKRKRVVQVVYASLAVIFLVGFVGFAIGSGNGPGGLFDAIGLGNGGSARLASTSSTSQIDSANAQLAKHPKTEGPAEAGQVRVSSRASRASPRIRPPARSRSARTPTPSWAARRRLGEVPEGEQGQAGRRARPTGPALHLLNDAPGQPRRSGSSPKTPSAGSYGQLAFYSYAGVDIPAGDAAAKKADSLAPKAQRKQTRSSWPRSASRP